MRKIIILFLMLVMSMFIFGNDTTVVKTLAETTNVAETITITEDTTYYQDICVDTTSVSTVFVVSRGATLELIDLDISSDGLNQISKIFYVESGGKLILDKVTFSNLSYSYCIENYGVVEVTGTTFLSTDVYSIYNLSSEENSIILHSGNLHKVRLNSGYISITKDYSPSGITQVVFPKDGYYTGKLVVKGVGENVFAGRYLDNFNFTQDSKYSNDDNLYLDYIGDSSSVITDANDSSLVLQSGDIVLTEKTLSFTSAGTSILHSAVNCTSAYFLSDENTSNKLYYSNLLERSLDNFSANSIANYSVVSSATDCVVSLRVNVVEGDVIKSYADYSYVAGTDYAIFIDIPTDYELDTVEYYNGQNEDETILQVRKSADNELKLYSNGLYCRPIIEYIGESYDSYIMTINFVFKPIEKIAKVTLENFDKATLTPNSDLVVGNSYTFKVEETEDIKVVAIEFNGNDIDFVKSGDTYEFTTIMYETNTIKLEYIDSLPICIELEPNPEKTTFVYGEEIVLKESYYVESTYETIEITYVPDTNVSVGEYYITQVENNNSEYYFTLAEGEYKYNIIQKELSIEDIETQSLVVDYSKDLELTAEDFITSMPEGFKCDLDINYVDLVAYSQTLRIDFDAIDRNYIIKESKTFIDVDLYINPVELDISRYKMEGFSTPYTGDAVVVPIENLDETLVNVDYEYTKVTNSGNVKVDNCLDSGVYKVVAKLSSKTTLYILDSQLESTIEITKINIDLSDYIAEVSNKSKTYDGKKYTFDFKEELLPEGITEITTSRSEFKDADEYYITINFTFDNNNYNCIESTTIKFTITKKLITVKLKESAFEYSAEVPNFEVELTGVEDGDVVNVNLSNIANVNAGTYYATILSIDNSNYTYDKDTTLKYKIEAVAVDMSNITFNNVDAVYDGENHLPTLTGTMPQGITYKIENKKCVNVGEYSVKCTFTSSNTNYETPSTLTATVTITPRPIYVSFAEPDNMIANNKEKFLNITFANTVVGNDVSFNAQYSSTTISAGQYICTVTLQNEPNYYIANNNVYEFVIYSNKSTFTGENLSIIFEGKFSASNQVVVTNTNNNPDVVESLEDMNVKNYQSVNFNCTEYGNGSIIVKVKLSDIASSGNYLKVYKSVDDGLESVDFEIAGNMIIFTITDSENIVFVERYSYMYVYRVEIFIITLFAILSAISMLSIYIVYILKNKKADK